MPAITAMPASSVRPYPYTAPIIHGASANSRAVAGTTIAAEVRRAYETSRRRPGRSLSAAARLIRGISAVTSETVTMPCGTTHS